MRFGGIPPPPRFGLPKSRAIFKGYDLVPSALFEEVKDHHRRDGFATPKRLDEGEDLRRGAPVFQFRR